ncbi:MAG: hypothetical protein PHW31_01190 [Candidatus Pacebacteria bacterium]|nr:hypothetical protein [Candidatus Paceibacterota bacterium]
MSIQTFQNKKKLLPTDLARAIFEEIRLLRQEISLILPQDDLIKYQNPERIKKSYQKALEIYPPQFYGNN